MPTPNPAGLFRIHSSMFTMWSGTLSSSSIPSASSRNSKSIVSRLPLAATTANCDLSLETQNEWEEAESEQGREQAAQAPAPAITEDWRWSGGRCGSRKDKDEIAIVRNASTQFWSSQKKTEWSAEHKCRLWATPKLGETKSRRMCETHVQVGNSPEDGLNETAA